MYEDEQQHEYLKVPEIPRVASSRAYELIADGKIPAVKIGRSVLVSRKELDRWLAGQRYMDAIQR